MAVTPYPGNHPIPGQPNFSTNVTDWTLWFTNTAISEMEALAILADGGTYLTQVSANDTTSNRILKTGAFGLGVAPAAAAIPVTTLNSAVVPGIYGYPDADPNVPVAASSGVVVVGKVSTNIVHQLAMTLSGQTYTRRSTDTGSTWSAWLSLSRQTGSNANGTYVRTPGVDQTCWRNITLASGTIAATPATFSFPATFSAVRSCSININQAVAGGSVAALAELAQKVTVEGASGLWTVRAHGYAGGDIGNVAFQVEARGVPS